MKSIEFRALVDPIINEYGHGVPLNELMNGLAEACIIIDRANTILDNHKNEATPVLDSNSAPR